ncbi:MAG: serine/threonine protein kinase [Phycisphaerales bacterium]|nr:serine/threonine protein kinase [Phycisphaerales bacterium]
MAASLPTQRSRLKPGALIRDTYTVVELLGSGRFADAYLVRHRFMGMQVMKLLVDGLSDEDRSDGLREAFLLSKIAHEGIIRVFDANHVDLKHGGHPYITMDHASAGTLEGLLGNCSGGLRMDAALDFGRQIADALAHAHRMDPPLVHRDIKPGNILFEPNATGDLKVKIGDFGLAMRVDRLLNLVSSGGTIMYMSPESFRGYETPASDVYSAGLVLYEMLIGAMPYPRHIFDGAEKATEIQRRLSEHQKIGFHPPSYFDGGITRDVDSVVMRALHHDETRRFQNGEELLHAIMACEHVQRSPDREQIESDHGSMLDDIFAQVSRSEDIDGAVHRLDHAMDEHPELVCAYLPHLRQLRVQQLRIMENGQ